MEYEHSIRAALKGAAPYIAVPVEGHAPLCIKSKLLKGAGKKWIAAEAHQARRPHKRPDGDKADDYRCRSKGHKFVNGLCEHCKEPEIDEVEAIECDFCRAIFEHTGRIHCPMHADIALSETPSLFLTKGELI